MLSRYPVEFAEARGRIRPGCTGLWQLSTSSGKLIYEAPEYDLAYLRGAGVRLDLWILYRTLRSFFPRPRAIMLDDLPRWTSPRTAVRKTKRVPEPVFEFEVERAAEPLSPMPARAEAYD